VSFAAITLCVASLRVFIVVYFVMDSVRKLLSTPSYLFVLFGNNNESSKHTGRNNTFQITDGGDGLQIWRIAANCECIE
jgi:hypothetical protein